ARSHRSVRALRAPATLLLIRPVCGETLRDLGCKPCLLRLQLAFERAGGRGMLGDEETNGGIAHDIAFGFSKAAPTMGAFAHSGIGSDSPPTILVTSSGVKDRHLFIMTGASACQMLCRNAYRVMQNPISPL